MALLECKDLSITFRTLDGPVHAVNEISLSVEKGECLGIVGESGSGKSQSFLAAMGLLAENGEAKGSIQFEGQEIIGAPRSMMNRIRGERMSMIFQDPMSSLTPFLSVGEQLTESLIEHKGVTKDQAKTRALEVLALVGIPAPERRYNQYPYELSGGMRQRVMIAQAIFCQPSVLIADEPTTALDVTVQAEILEIFSGLKKHSSAAIILITHDLGVVAGLCDRIAVMYGGRVVETGSAEDIFYNPQHPYTQGLLSSIPSLDHDPDEELPGIPGQPPLLRASPVSCTFAERCAHVHSRCRTDMPELRPVGPGHFRACHLERAP